MGACERWGRRRMLDTSKTDAETLLFPSTTGNRHFRHLSAGIFRYSKEVWDPSRQRTSAAEVSIVSERRAERDRRRRTSVADLSRKRLWLAGTAGGVDESTFDRWMAAGRCSGASHPVGGCTPRPLWGPPKEE